MEGRVGFWPTLGWSSIIWGAFLGASLAGRAFADAAGASPALAIVVKGIVPGVVGVLAAVVVQARLNGADGVASSLGLRRASPRGLFVGLVAGLPLAIAYLLIFGYFGVDPEPVPDVGLVVLKFFVAQGIAEEVMFRGFVFGRLRRGRSFLRAATLSAVVFALVHLSNFIAGFTVEVLVSVVISTVFAFVLTYPAALLYERAGQSIWPFALTHVLIDSVNWFVHVSTPGPGLSIYLLAVLATAGWTVVLALRMRPRQELPRRSWAPMGPGAPSRLAGDHAGAAAAFQPVVLDALDATCIPQIHHPRLGEGEAELLQEGEVTA